MSIQKPALAIFILSTGLMFFTEFAESASFSTPASSITVESGATDNLFNISVKTEETGAKNITGVSFVFPVGPFSASQPQASAANLSVAPSITSTSQPVNITFSNPSLLAGGSGATGHFSFRASAPTGTATERTANTSVYMTIYVYDQDGAITSSTVTIYLNDSSQPSNLRFSSPTKANNAFTSNSTGDFEAHFSEANPSSVILKIGFPNGTQSNRTMAVQAVGQAGKASVSVSGFPEGKHNFTFSAADREGFSSENSSAHYITTDLTPPTASLTLPSSDATKGSTISSANLTCSASDALSGVDSTQTLTITKPSSNAKVTHTCGNSFTDTSETGDYSVIFTVQDKAGNSATKTGSFRVKDTSTQDTPSVQSNAVPDSSSIQSTPTETQPLASETAKASGTLEPGKPVSFPMPKAMQDNGLLAIHIESTSIINASEASIESRVFDRIPLVDDKNQSLKPLPSGVQKPIKIFQFIPSANLTNKIRQANITFRLTKTELQNTSAESIVLLRFSGGNWTELPAYINRSTQNESTEFTSTASGFSVFVVSSKPTAAVQANQTQTQPPNTQPAAPENNASDQPSAASAKVISDGVPDYAFYISVPVIAAALVVIFMRRKKSGKPARKNESAKKDMDYYKKIIRSN